MYLRYFNILYSNADILTTSCWLVSIKYWKLKNHKFFGDQFPVKDTQDPDIVTTLPRSKIEEKLPAEQNLLGMDDMVLNWIWFGRFAKSAHAKPLK